MHDVYLIGLFDDYMTYWMVDQTEWDRLGKSKESLGDMIWKPLVIKEFIDENDYDEDEDEDEEEFSYSCSFDLDKILELVKDGKINVLGTAEGLHL